MNIGVDFGAVIQKYPEIFKHLLRWHRNSGDVIHMLPGRDYHKYYEGTDKEIHEQVMAAYKDKFDTFEIPYDFLMPHDNESHNGHCFKGKYCRDHKIDVMYENEERYFRDIQKWSPETKLIKVD